MQHERISTLETLKWLHQQERRVNWSHGFQNLTLVAVMVLGGSWLLCGGGAPCWAENASGGNAASVENKAPTTNERNETQVKWLKDYDEALDRAKKLDQPVLIDFAASWCVPCVMMDKHVWPEDAVQEILASNVVPLRIDMDATSATRLVEKYKVEFVPTILLIDADGKELKREGFLDVEPLLEMIKTTNILAGNK